jgi:O-acetyl-ADP-ribose deacetylase (regulator of RNase III)
MMEKRFCDTVVELIMGDITELEADAIVNAANSHLAHGGGVAAAIVRKGGKVIQAESDSWIYARGEVGAGSAAITTGGNLKARYVIHAVGPMMGEGDEDSKLKNATLSSLRLAEKYKFKIIAFPAISTGIFGYPLNRCAQIMFSAVIEYIQEGTKIERIVFCLWGKEAYALFRKTFSSLKNTSPT